MCTTTEVFKISQVLWLSPILTLQPSHLLLANVTLGFRKLALTTEHSSEFLSIVLKITYLDSSRIYSPMQYLGLLGVENESRWYC